MERIAHLTVFHIEQLTIEEDDLLDGMLHYGHELKFIKFTEATKAFVKSVETKYCTEKCNVLNRDNK